MFPKGVYPAAVTPFLPNGKVDMPAVARLLAHFEAAGCVGVTLAGSNGEGPSLSAVEKRDLIKEAIPLKGTLNLMLGVCTSSLNEAQWLCDQAAKAGALAVTLMPPGYFREADPRGILDWFHTILKDAPLPILIYNFPQRCGFTLEPQFLSELAEHANFAGVKDSSGEIANLPTFKRVLPDHALFVGNEILLWPALDQGWSGTISGAANALAPWLCRIVAEFGTESGETKFELVRGPLQILRDSPQPSVYKAILHKIGVLPSDTMRLPLQACDDEAIVSIIEKMQERLGSLAG